MSVRLIQKKQKAILKQIDSIVMTHRVKIYQQLNRPAFRPRIDAATAEAITDILGEMNRELIRAVGEQFDDLLREQTPVLPLRPTADSA